jgi:hypothetical protein
MKMTALFSVLVLSYNSNHDDYAVENFIWGDKHINRNQTENYISSYGPPRCSGTDVKLQIPTFFQQNKLCH